VLVSAVAHLVFVLTVINIAILTYLRGTVHKLYDTLSESLLSYLCVRNVSN